MNLFEDFALVEFATVLIGGIPREVLLHQLLDFLRSGIQFLP